MKAFEYASPATPELALQALKGRQNSAVLSGGTDLLARMKEPLLDIAIYAAADFHHIPGIGLGGVVGVNVGVGELNLGDFNIGGRRLRRGFRIGFRGPASNETQTEGDY